MKTLILNKTLKIFEALTQAENPLTLKEICRRTGITSPAASRLLSDLTESGYVHKVSYREFEPGLGMIYLGQGSLRHNFFPQNATIIWFTCIIPCMSTDSAFPRFPCRISGFPGPILRW